MISTLLAASLALAPQGTPTISDYFQNGFKDASFVIKVISAKHGELGKINKDFGEMYKFDSVEVKIKEPFMLRLTGTVNDTSVLFVQNGATRYWSVPKLRLKKRENLDEEPGKRQTPLDFGFLTPTMFQSLFVSQYVRADRATNDAVFDVRYHPRFEYGSWFRIWIDPAKKVITKREWYRRQRHLATFYYLDAKEEGGVWLPTRMRVKNVDDKIAGETVYEAMKINRGLDDDLFKVR